MPRRSLLSALGVLGQRTESLTVADREVEPRVQFRDRAVEVLPRQLGNRLVEGRSFKRLVRRRRCCLVRSQGFSRFHSETILTSTRPQAKSHDE
jgi:hypothetical protein